VRRSKFRRNQEHTVVHRIWLTGQFTDSSKITATESSSCRDSPSPPHFRVLSFGRGDVALSLGPRAASMPREALGLEAQRQGLWPEAQLGGFLGV